MTSSSEVESPAFVQRLAVALQAYGRNPRDSAVMSDLRHARSMLAAYLMDTPEEGIRRVFSNQFTKLHLTLAGNGLRDLPLDTEERLMLDRVLSVFAGKAKDNNLHGHILAAMLYCRPDDPRVAFLDRRIPDWMCSLYTVFLVTDPMFFDDAGAYRRYREFVQRMIHHLHRVVADGIGRSPSQAARARATALAFATFSCPIHPYFGDDDLKDISVSRAFILEQNARAAGLDLDWNPPARPADRTRIRVGILKPHYTIQTETFATLPVFEHLDRDEFEIILYAVDAARNEMEAYCASRADRLTLLPGNPRDQAKVIRDDRLDVLFFGSNLMARVNACTTLALHRLAPVQVASICCPITTGFANMDCYLAGDLLAPAADFQRQFRETLVNMPGSGICFSYGPEPARGTQPMSRRQLGLPAGATVFISGANYFKITPEVREAWTTIVSRVPGSVLALYPFNPYWSAWYDQEPFMADLRNRFARRGLGGDRLVILPPAPDRTHVKARLGVADVYLDSFPYGGATSLIDTLEVRVPPVVIRGNTLRSRQASSMLEELRLPQLVAGNQDAYVELAVSLGTDAGLRNELRDKIDAVMKKHPPCLDSRAYARHVAQVLHSLCERRFRNEA